MEITKELQNIIDEFDLDEEFIDSKEELRFSYVSESITTSELLKLITRLEAETEKMGVKMFGELTAITDTTLYSLDEIPHIKIIFKIYK